MTIKRPFNPGTNVDENDTLHFKRTLNRLGYYTPHKDIGMTGFPDREIFDSLKSFQRDHGLRTTGTAKPGDETVRKLSQLISQNHGRTASREKYGPPDCRRAYEDYNQTRRKLETLEDKKENLLEKIKNLTEENNQIITEMQITLGIRLATFLIELPWEKIPYAGELLRKAFGNVISDQLMEKADRLAQERGNIQRQKEYAQDQLKVVVSQVQSAKIQLEKSSQTLENCRRGYRQE